MLSQNLGAIGWVKYGNESYSVVTHQNDLFVLVNVKPEIWNVPNDTVEEKDRVVMLTKHGLVTRLIRSDGWKLWFDVLDGSRVDAR